MVATLIQSTMSGASDSSGSIASNNSQEVLSSLLSDLSFWGDLQPIPENASGNHSINNNKGTKSTTNNNRFSCGASAASSQDPRNRTGDTLNTSGDEYASLSSSSDSSRRQRQQLQQHQQLYYQQQQHQQQLYYQQQQQLYYQQQQQQQLQLNGGGVPFPLAQGRSLARMNDWHGGSDSHLVNKEEKKLEEIEERNLHLRHAEQQQQPGIGNLPVMRRSAHGCDSSTDGESTWCDQYSQSSAGTGSNNASVVDLQYHQQQPQLVDPSLLLVQQQQQQQQQQDSGIQQQHSYCSSSSSSTSPPNSPSGGGERHPGAPPQQPKSMWKTARDPVTGRTYYYDAITRKTQWEKPDEIRADERKARKEKKKQDRMFFEDVKRNVLASLARGELIPGIPREDIRCAHQGLSPQEPANASTSQEMSLRMQKPSPYQQSLPQSTSQQQHQARIRTISGMNEQLLAELRSNDPILHPLKHPHQQQAGATTASTTASAPRSGGPSTIVRNPISPTGSTGGTVTVEGRPPLMPPRPAAPKPTIQSNSSSSTDSLDLSPDDVQAKTATDAAAGVALSLRGEMLLDGPIMEGASGAPAIRITVDDGDGPSATAVAAAGSDAPPTSSSAQDNGSGSPPLGGSSCHIRRNTGGTIFLRSTMENPDVNATIKCVCGVYRAHVVQAAARRTQLSPVSVMSSQQAQAQQVHFNNVNLDVFRDDYDETAYPASYQNYRHNTNNAPANSIDDVPVPTLKEIETFYHDFFRRSQMEQDTIIMSLIYVERLIKETNGALTPAPHNWRSILFSCMVLSSKVWDDLSMFNLDFSNVSMASGLSSFSLQRTNQLEVAVLQCLNFCVKVPASEYAKYYFLIRTMLIRSGLLEGADVPLRKDCHVLENRTREYQDSKLNKGNDRRARSVDWSNLFGQEMDPVLPSTMCLEQLVSMDQK